MNELESQRSFDLIRGGRNERLRVGSIGIRKFSLLVQSRPLIPTFPEPQLQEEGKKKTKNPLNKRIQCCQFVNIHHPSTVNTYRIVFTFYFLSLCMIMIGCSQNSFNNAHVLVHRSRMLRYDAYLPEVLLKKKPEKFTSRVQYFNFR